MIIVCILKLYIYYSYSFIISYPRKNCIINYNRSTFTNELLSPTPTLKRDFIKQKVTYLSQQVILKLLQKQLELK